MQQSLVEQHAHERRDAADGDQFGHQVLAARPEVGQHRHAAADAREVVEFERHARGARDREQVQDGIRRPAERDDGRDRVLERLARQDRGGPEPALASRRTTASPARRQSASLSGDTASCAELLGRLMPSASIAEAMVFAVYMPPQDPGPGIAVRSISCEAGVVEVTLGVTPDGLEHADDVAAPGARPDRAAVDEHGRPVEAGERHHAARHVLVAAADRDQSVEALGARDGLDRVGDDLARHQRVTHAGRAHRDAVRHGDRVEQHVASPGLAHAAGGGLRELADVQVAGGHAAPGRGDPDLGAPEIRVGEADRAQHGAVRRALGAVDHLPRVLAWIFVCHVRPSCRMAAAVDKAGAPPGR